MAHVALAAAVLVLVLTNLLNNRLARSYYVATSLVGTAVLLVLFWLTGLPWAVAGLGRDTLGRGIRWGLVAVALAAGVYAVAALVPVTRAAFLDRRVERAGIRQAAYEVVVRIPLGTVVLEEVAFRGVLLGLARPSFGTGGAVVLSCLLFGLWHVLPSSELPRLNPVAGAVFATRPAWVVPAAVVATALAGAILCELVRRSESLVPAMALHWATNALGYLTAFLVTRRR
jgi:membrane protease YdiL (CAAX protease family)